MNSDEWVALTLNSHYENYFRNNILFFLLGISCYIKNIMHKYIQFYIIKFK